MKEIESYKEDDYRYKDFELDKKEIKKLSEYFDYKFNADETHLLVMYGFMGDLIAAQVQENYTWDLTPEEFEKLFSKAA